MSSPHAAIGTTLLCGVLAAPAHAGRPLQTEDAGILEPADCELEGASARLKAFGARAREASLQIGCGIGLSTQLALRAAREHADDQRASGLGLSGKTALWQGERDGAAALALAYGADWSKASAGDWRHAESTLNLAYSHPLDAATVHANLGYADQRQGGTDAVTWGLAYEHDGFGAWAPMAELFGDDREAPWWNLGLRWTVLPERLTIDASYGRQIAGGRPVLWTLGFKLAF